MNPLPALAPGRHRPLVIKLLLLTGASLAFGLALVPLYDTLCRVVGLNGRTGDAAAPVGQVVSTQVDRTRRLTVQFTSTLMPGLPWEIRPLEPVLELHPGEVRTTRFLVRNTSAQSVIGQAVPSVSPTQAAAHFQKVECFCFTQQTLAPGESREMPLVFVVQPELDARVREITLAYAFFPAPGQGPGSSTTGDAR